MVWPALLLGAGVGALMNPDDPLMGALQGGATGGVGAAFSPAAAALTSGGIEAARTGDLGQGALAGLGAYGMSSLTNSISDIGAASGGGATAPTVGGVQDTLANIQTMPAGVTPPPVSGIDGGAMAQPQWEAGLSLAPYSGVADAALNSAPVQGAMGVADTVRNSAPVQGLMNNDLARGLKTLGADNSGDALKAFYGENKIPIIAGATGAFGRNAYREEQAALEALKEQEEAGEAEYNKSRNEILKNYADRGLQMPRDPFTNRLAGGGPVMGVGDGLSDSVPAVIDGQDPAELSSGEFVIPADVVSYLGNGSTDAGVQALQQMMDDVRKQKTGTEKQAGPIIPEEYLPS